MGSAAGRSVVVTGASSGIGRASALQLLRSGFEVFGSVRTKADAARLQAEGIRPIHLDLTVPATIEAAAEVVRADVGARGLAGLVNNAGIAVAGPVELLRLKTLRRQLEVNVVGQVAVVQAFIPLLRRGAGRIVFMSSMSGRIAMPCLGAYAASKFALEAIVDALRLELKPFGIEVVSIQPGPVATPIWAKSLAVSEALFETEPVEDAYVTAMAIANAAARRSARTGISAAAVAEVVVRALTVARPRTRYPVGPYARLLALALRVVPDRLRDRCIQSLRRHGALDSGRNGDVEPIQR